MKRMFLMTLMLSVIAVGSVMANDNSVDRGPKKKVIVTINPCNIGPSYVCGDCHHHVFGKPKPHKMDCHHGKRHDWRDDHKHDKRPHVGPHNNNRPPKWNNGHDKGNRPNRGYGRK